MGQTVKIPKRKAGKLSNKSELADLAGFLDILIQIDLTNKSKHKKPLSNEEKELV